MKKLPRFSRAIIQAVLFLVAGLARETHADVLYVSNPGNGSIVRFDSLGSGIPLDTFGIHNRPLGLAFDNGGNLFVSDSDSIFRFDALGNKSVFVDSGLLHPNGLAFDKSGNLFVGNAGVYQIMKFDGQGTGSVFAGYPAIFGPEALAFDSHGNLYVANTSANTIAKIDPSGNDSVFATFGLSNPDGLAFDRDGNLFVSNTANNTILKFDPQGRGTLFAASGLNQPRGLAFDGAGNLYVANYGNHTIQRFDPQGQGTVFADSGLSYPSYIAVVPEPSALAIMVVGFVVLFCFRFSKRSTRMANRQR